LLGPANWRLTPGISHRSSRPWHEPPLPWPDGDAFDAVGPPETVARVAEALSATGAQVVSRDAYEAVVPGYHLNKRHWNTVTIDGSLEDQLVRDMIEDSYDLVVSALPRRTREALGWDGERR
jgi:hypothetical protein